MASTCPLAAESCASEWRALSSALAAFSPPPPTTQDRSGLPPPAQDHIGSDQPSPLVRRAAAGVEPRGQTLDHAFDRLASLLPRKRRDGRSALAAETREAFLNERSPGSVRRRRRQDRRVVRARRATVAILLGRKRQVVARFRRCGIEG